MKTITILTVALFIFSCGNPKEKAENEESKAVENQNKNQNFDEPITPNTAYDKEDSLKTINEQIRSDIDNPDLYLKRSKIYEDLQDDKAAIADIDRAVKIDSVYLPTLLAQSDFLMTRGKVIGSLTILENANKLYPDNSEIYTKMGALYLISKNLDKALSYADLAIKYDKFNSKAYYVKGYTFLELGDTTRAISSYRTAIEQDPDYFDAYLELGLIFSLKNDPLTLDYLGNALKIRPNEKRALYSKGMYEQENELYNEAIITYTTAIKAHPDFKEAHYNLGFVHMYYLRLYREATNYYTDAIKIDSRYFQAYYNRGYSFELMGDIKNAELDYKKCLEINPAYDLAANGLSRIKE